MGCTLVMGERVSVIDAALSALCCRSRYLDYSPLCSTLCCSSWYCARTPDKKPLKGGRVLWWPWPQAARGGRSMPLGPLTSLHLWNKKKKGRACLADFLFSLFVQSRTPVLPMFRVGLFLKILLKHPQRHIQRCVSLVPWAFLKPTSWQSKLSTTHVHFKDVGIKA